MLPQLVKTSHEEKEIGNRKKSALQYNTDLSCVFRIPDSIGKDIEKACQGIYPLHDVFIRKVKVLKKPKFDGNTYSSFKPGFLTIKKFGFALFYRVWLTAKLLVSFRA